MTTPKLQLPKKYTPEPIAIVGLGAIMPDANNVEEFWSNIVTGKNSVTEVPLDRWDPELYFDTDRDAPDKTYSKIGAFVRDFKLNPIEYRIPPNVLTQIDMVQQWALASAKQALEDAHYENDDFPRERTAVIIGNSLGGEKSFELSQRVYFPATVEALKKTENFQKLTQEEQEDLFKELEKIYKSEMPVINEDSMPGELANIVAGRVAATFNLRGKNMTSDAACASSLAAMDIAFKGLQAYEYDAAVVGGSDRSMDPPTFVKFAKIGALSADGSFPFDARANGFVQGEGSGMMVLKRLSDALKSGDKIYALVTGVGSSSDGKGKAITAPNPIGQELAVRRALDAANTSANEIQLLEAHGTATSVGDFVEVSTIEKVYIEQGAKPHSVKIGSIKSQIGHLKSAAGAAGLLKAALAIHHKTFPPSINFETPNPKIDWANSPLVVNTQPIEWPKPVGTQRRAGVSSFGFGGVNFHVIMEEYDPNKNYETAEEFYASIAPSPQSVTTQSYDDYIQRNLDLVPEPLLVSGSSVDELKHNLDGLITAKLGINFIKDQAAPTLIELIKKLNFKSKDKFRTGISPDDLDKLDTLTSLAKGAVEDEKKRELARNRGVFVSQGLPSGKIAFLFPGQGSQYADMIIDLAQKYKIVEDTLQEADKTLKDMLDKPLSAYIKSSGDSKATEEGLRQTQITQPAMLTADIAIYRLFKAYGVNPDMVAGHSLGEYGALVAAGVLNFADALKAVAIRGKAMSEVDADDKGTMASITGSLEDVEKVLKKVKGYAIAANKNSLTSTVISGSTEGIEEAIKKFKDAGMNAIPLSVSAAFHTKIVEPAAEPLSEFLDQIEFSKPKIPITSNVTGDFFPDDPEKIRDLMKKQVGASVEWTKQVQSMFKKGATSYFEIGPKRALSSFVSDILANENIISVVCNHPKKGGIRTLNDALAAFGALGIEIKRPGPDDEIYHPLYRKMSVAQPVRPQVTSPASQQVSQSASSGLGYDQYEQLIGHVSNFIKSDAGKAKNLGMNFDNIVITGTGVGLPGMHKEVFAPDNVDRVLRGDNLIEKLPREQLEAQLEKNIRRLIKKSTGEAEFYHPSSYDDVIRLAGQAGKFDINEEFGLKSEISSTYDIATALAIAAGLEALKDAGIPLVREYKKTSTGSYLPGDYVLPQELQDGTGIIFASAFPGLDSFAKEVTSFKDYQMREKSRDQLTELYGDISRRVTGKDKDFLLEKIDRELKQLDKEIKGYTFNRKILLEVLSFGHAQFAQLIKARGPNTQTNAACASTTQALGIAQDWIRTGRARRVIVISADNVTAGLFEWLGSGFLASGAASIKEKVEEAALPFDRRRGGMIIGMGAAAFVVEPEAEAQRRGVTPIVELVGTYYSNSAYHGTRLDTVHVSKQLQNFMDRVEQVHGISRDEIAKSLMFMSHETYTPARGGSAAAEIRSLRETFGSLANQINIANTKGFTGHPMGAGIEDAIAIKSIEKGKIPPIANFKEPDPDLGDLKLSQGGTNQVEFGLRLAAGFGSQIAFALYRRRGSGNRMTVGYNAWIASLGGSTSDLYLEGKTLKMKDTGPPTGQIAAPIKAQRRAPTKPTQTSKPVSRSQPVATTPSTSFSGGGKSEILDKIQDVMASMTGYPKSMLDPTLDIEADLGIDTVKMAESIGQLNETFGIDPEATMNVADYNTIAKVADYYAARLGDGDTSSVAKPSPVTTKTHVQSPSSSGDSSEIIDKIQDVMSSMTGYPKDMLDPKLDIEADLGIDTVKMAESIGQLNETFGVDPEATMNVADYNTIEKVAEYYANRLSGGSSAVSGTTPVSPSASPSPSASSGDKSRIVDKIQDVMASMTGYPKDMLDPKLDIEADLGIDTVKMAESIGQLNDAFGVSSEEMMNIAEYNTIEKVADYYMGRLSGESSPAKPAPVKIVATPSPRESIPLAATEAPGTFEKVVAIISEITGYPAVMIPDGNINLRNDLGVDDQIKKVIDDRITKDFGLGASELDDVELVQHYINIISGEFGGGLGTTTPVKQTTVKPQKQPQKQVKKSLHEGPAAVSDALRNKVYDIISEVTGYPPLMIDDSLNLKSDLGIDDAAKSKIVNAITAQMSGNAADLMQALSVGDLLHVLSGESLPELIEEPPKAVIKRSGGESVEETLKSVTEIIAEKTGYPPEMLDPTLDLESELGIDTVKQAEIFGEARERYGIPPIDGMVLSDYNTITKLAELLNEKASETVETGTSIETDHSTTTNKTTGPKTHRYVLRENQVDVTTKITGKYQILAYKKSVTKKLVDTIDSKVVSKIKDLNMEDCDSLIIANPDESLISDLSEFFVFLKSNIDQLKRVILALKYKDISNRISDLTPLQGAIGGMFKSLAMEFPEIIAKIVIYNKTDELLEELESPGVEVAYRDGKRYESALSEEDLPEKSYSLPENAVILASGGAQGITFELIKSIVTNTSTVILLGRTEIREDAEELSKLTETQLKDRKMALMKEMQDKGDKVTPVVLDKEWSKREKSLAVFNSISTLSEIGCSVIYEPVDVTNKSSVENAFKDIRDKLDTKDISHFIHGAGIEISRATKSKSVDEFNLVYSVKAAGFDNLLTQMKLDKLQLVVGFSSVAGRFGNATQIDYSAANEYLAKRCAELSREGLRTIVIDWSAWADIGMATRGSTMKVLESQGVTAIPIEEGIARFQSEIAAGEELEVVISGELGALASKVTWYQPDFFRGIMMDDYSAATLDATRVLSLTKDRFLDDHRIEGKAVLPGVMGMETMAELTHTILGNPVSAIYNVEFVSPVKLPRDQDLEIRTFAHIIGKSLKLDLKSKFLGPDGKQLGDLRHHFQSTMVACERLPGFPVLSKKSLNEIKDSNLLSQEKIYETFFHGPSYQVIKQINKLYEDAVIATFNRPEKSMFEDNDSTLEINPLMIEAAFQTAGLHMLYHKKEMGLPSAVDAIHFFNSKKEPALISAYFVKEDDQYATYHVEIMDEDGLCLALLQNYKMIKTGKVDTQDLVVSESDDLILIRKTLGKLDAELVAINSDSLEEVSENFINEFLGKAEQTRFSALQAKKKRGEWLAGRIAAKLMLAHHLKIGLSEIQIDKDENRAPFTMLGEEKIDVSITHSNGIAIAAVDTTTVDLEKIEKRAKSFIKESFSDEEIKEYDLLNNDESTITKYWTMKEAHLKRMRIGLKTPLHGVRISDNGGNTAIVSSPQGKSFVQSQITGDFVITIAKPDDEAKITSLF